MKNHNKLKPQPDSNSELDDPKGNFEDIKAMIEDISNNAVGRIDAWANGSQDTSDEKSDTKETSDSANPEPTLKEESMENTSDKPSKSSTLEELGKSTMERYPNIKDFFRKIGETAIKQTYKSIGLGISTKRNFVEYADSAKNKLVGTYTDTANRIETAKINRIQSKAIKMNEQFDLNRNRHLEADIYSDFMKQVTDSEGNTSGTHEFFDHKFENPTDPEERGWENARQDSLELLHEEALKQNKAFDKRKEGEGSLEFMEELLSDSIDVDKSTDGDSQKFNPNNDLDFNTAHPVFDKKYETPADSKEIGWNKARDEMIENIQDKANGLNKHFDEHGEALSMNKNFNEHLEAIEMDEEFDGKLDEAERIKKLEEEEADRIKLEKEAEKLFAERLAIIKAREAEARARSVARAAKREAMVALAKDKISSSKNFTTEKIRGLGRAVLRLSSATKAGVRAGVKEAKIAYSEKPTE